jgi:hypothetical protein
MLNFVNVFDIFEAGIFQDDAGAEGFVDGDVDVLVDGGGKDEAGVLAVVRGENGAATTE